MRDKMIKQYVRDKKGVPVGVLVAVSDDSMNVVTFGWSLCHKSDQFSKEKGTMIALNRANCDKSLGVPETLEKPLEKFMERAGRYFFDSDLYIESLR